MTLPVWVQIYNTHPIEDVKALVADRKALYEYLITHHSDKYEPTDNLDEFFDFDNAGYCEEELKILIEEEETDVVNNFLYGE